MEGLLSALWVKFIPLALKTAIQESPDVFGSIGKSLTVKLLGGSGVTKRLMDCTPWECLNLGADQSSDLPYGAAKILSDNGVRSPVSFGSGAAHYSISKGVSILGLGANCHRVIPTDGKARLDLDLLRLELERCLENQTPVFCVVGVLGTTEMGAIDDIEGLLALREDVERYGVDEADSIIESGGLHDGADNPVDACDPVEFCSDHLRRQLQACHLGDSMTIDPHKSGYINYPAGTVYIGGGKDTKEEPKVAIYGIAGSTSGAAAMAVYFSHSVIRTSVSGYGRLLKRCLLNAKLFYLRLLRLGHDLGDQCNYKVITLAKPPPKDQLDKIFNKIIPSSTPDHWLTSEEIVKDRELLKELSEIGSDHAIVCYNFNFRMANGEWNSDYQQLVKFNEAIYRRFHPMNASQDLVIAETKVGSGGVFDLVEQRLGITTTKRKQDDEKKTEVVKKQKAETPTKNVETKKAPTPSKKEKEEKKEAKPKMTAEEKIEAQKQEIEKEFEKIEKEKKSRRIGKKEKAETEAREAKALKIRTAVSQYLTAWKNDKSKWKFNKMLQLDLIQGLYDRVMVPEKIFVIALEYLDGMQGKARETTLAQATEASQLKVDDEETEENNKLRLKKERSKRLVKK
eukprot:gene20633-24783_t